MKTYDVVVNRLPVLTWNRLRMNKTTVSQVTLPVPGQTALSGPAQFTTAECPQFDEMATGSGKELSDLLVQGAIVPQCITMEGENASVKLLCRYDADQSTANRIDIYLKENSVSTLLMDFTADSDASGQGMIQTRIYAEPNARLHLIQTQRVGSGFTFFNDIGAVCEADARIQLTQLNLDGAKSYYGCEVALKGDRSSFDAGIAYALQQGESMDMNYVVRHIGRHTHSDINAGGSLREGSAKLFRGTIDFINGAAGSVGSEKEEVLLLDDNCINQTIPLILCAEEDVEGNHGASIGKPDEEVLFYLSSRGLTEEEAYALLARAKLDAVAGRIPDAEFRQEIYDYIKGGVSND